MGAAGSVNQSLPESMTVADAKEFALKYGLPPSEFPEERWNELAHETGLVSRTAFLKEAEELIGDGEEILAQDGEPCEQSLDFDLAQGMYNDDVVYDETTIELANFGIKGRPMTAGPPLNADPA